MGQEIDRIHFKQSDFLSFAKALQKETEMLKSWIETDSLADGGYFIGFELESWLLSPEMEPLAINQAFLERFNDEMATPELAKFNVEFNTTARELTGDVFQQMEDELKQTWNRAVATARQLNDSHLLAIGILPTVRPEHLCMTNMTEMKRYRALNEQVLRLRKGMPIHLDIKGREQLSLEHHDVMLESAATSFQIHLQTPAEVVVRHYNASKIVSAPMVAVSANSPMLFGHDLWDETRIPLFQQAVSVTDQPYQPNAPHGRITFGEGYIHDSLFECFQSNLDNYEILLPLHYDDPPETLNHLRLHNGTIWRWNRPLIGFNGGKKAHLRIEHRVIPSGPSIVDMIANAAFYYGMVRALAEQRISPESQLPFNTARENFYHAARNGLNCEVIWLDGEKHPIHELITKTLLPLAGEGLELLGINPDHIQHYLDIIAQRTISKQNGAQWQRDYIAKHGKDMQALTLAYYKHQCSELPVHQWPV